MITLQQVTLQRGQRVLLDKTDLMITSGQKVGIIGSNGSGKSSLFLLLRGELSAEHGDATYPKQAELAYILQEIPSGEQTARDYVLSGDREYADLQQRLELAEASDDGMAIAEIHGRFAEIDGYAAPSRASKILRGLGFSQDELTAPVDSFSGGWRMRLNLAQVLIARSDILLLDEPTNHLDLDAIIWLEEWLQKSAQTIILISHDREFLDQVTLHTVHLRECKLHLYTGNYSAFERIYAEQLILQQATYEKQARHRAHLQSFVDRFGAKASKAKQAQSRVKMIEKIQWAEAVHQKKCFSFSVR